MSIWAAVLAHANFVHHGLGWLEGGLCASFEKFIIDAEMLQGMAEVLRPVSVTAADLAVDAIEAVGIQLEESEIAALEAPYQAHPVKGMAPGKAWPMPPPRVP